MAITVDQIKANVNHLVTRMNTIITNDETINVDICISRAIADLGVGLSAINPETKLSLAIELRVLYYAVMEARLTVMFDYNVDTGNEGRQIDKSKRSAQLGNMASELDRQYRDLRSGAIPVSGTWSMAGRVIDTIDTFAL